MITVKIKENSFLAKLAARRLKANSMAIVFNKTIHLYNVDRKRFLENTKWVKHEIAHVFQYQRKGVLRFVISYLLNTFYVGYKNNIYEIEARAEEKNPSILKNIQFE